MKAIVVIILLLSFKVGFSQSAETNDALKSIENGNIRVEGIDDLGAHVLVVYNKEHQKVYQERTTNNEIVYAKYDKGMLIASGVIQKPIMIQGPDGE